MKIIIKLPTSGKDTFKLQSRGNFPARRYKTAAGVIERIVMLFSGTGLKEKTAIVVKEYIGSHFENINESLPSLSGDYLIYVTVCFLEDYLSAGTIRKYEKLWTKSYFKNL